MMYCFDAKYFSDYSFRKALLYASLVVYILATSLVFLLEAIIPLPECEIQYRVTMPNPLYNENPCRHQRYVRLLFLTPDECSFGRRLLLSVILGSIVGWERREADRPAGIRTMSLVSLGSCLFSITSAYAFIDGPMTWDASRVAAAIPSGVGFLGAGLIFKDSTENKKTGSTHHVVHGLTTSASLWISAAVGVACAGELYFAAAFAVALVLTLLRFGPRQHFYDPKYENDDDECDEEQAAKGFTSIAIGGSVQQQQQQQQPGGVDNGSVVSTITFNTSERTEETPLVDNSSAITQSLRTGQSHRYASLAQSQRQMSKSFRARASLGAL